MFGFDAGGLSKEAFGSLTKEQLVAIPTQAISLISPKLFKVTHTFQENIMMYRTSETLVDGRLDVVGVDTEPTQNDER